MHRRRTALRALCGGGVLAARGTAGRKAGRCTGCDTRIWARTCVLAERRGNAAAICAGRICAQAGYHAACGGYTICGGLYSVSPSHRLKLHGNPRHVPALAWQSGRRGARVILVTLRSGGLSRRMWRLRDLRRAGTQSGRRTGRTGRNHAADNGACQRCASAARCSAACHCALNCAIDCCL